MSSSYWFSDPVNVYIVFTNSDFKTLQWLTKGFQHCFILYEFHNDVWVTFDPLLSCHEVCLTLADSTVQASPMSLLDESGASIVLFDPIYDGKILSPFSLQTCVNACKRVLGIRNPFIQTPYALYKYIKRKKRQQYEQTIRL